MDAALVALCAVFGLVIGSFANVVIQRVPRKESIVRPRSRCPQCEHQIGDRDNIPVLSWILLRGRCRACGASIGVRYPLVELGTAALFAAAALRLGADWSLPAFCAFFGALLAIAVIDLEHFIIPNRVLFPTVYLAGALLGGAAVATGDLPALEHAAIGGAIGFGALLVVHLISPAGMGYGDVRLAGLIGMMTGWLGLGYVALALFLSFLLASIIGIGLIVTRRRGRKDAVPFGPFMAMGAVIAVLWGQSLLNAYRR